MWCSPSPPPWIQPEGIIDDHDLSSENEEVDAANAANGDGDDMDVTNSDFDEYSWCGTWEMREFDICLICCVGLSCAIGL